MPVQNGNTCIGDMCILTTMCGVWIFLRFLTDYFAWFRYFAWSSMVEAWYNACLLSQLSLQKHVGIGGLQSISTRPEHA